MTAERFALHIAEPSAGWLPLVVVLDDQRFDLVASDVLNDPLDELIDVFVAAARPGRIDASVRIWEEPATTTLRFVSDDGSANVRITLSEGGDWPGGAGGGPSMKRYAGEFDRADVARAVLTALRLYQTCLPHDGETPGWRKPLSKKLNDVTGAAPGDRVFVAPWKEVHGLQRVVDELNAEVGPKHPLFRVGASVVARRVDNDDYLFALESGPDPLAVVHLTWSGTRESDPRWPSTQFYSSWNDWVARCMTLDSTGLVEADD